MHIPDLDRIMLTPSEAKFLQNGTSGVDQDLSERIRVLRLTFAQQYPPSPEADLDAMGVPMSLIALFESAMNRPVQEQARQRLFEYASLDAAAKAAKDEAGAERHLIGPLALSGEELRTVHGVAEWLGAWATCEVVPLQEEVDAKIAAGHTNIDDFRLLDTLELKDAASSVTMAIRTYLDTQDPK